MSPTEEREAVWPKSCVERYTEGKLIDVNTELPDTQSISYQWYSKNLCGISDRYQ